MCTIARNSSIHYSKYSFGERSLGDVVPSSPSSENRMKDLPPELLLQIFQHLNAVELCSVGAVCSYWNYVSTSEILWRRLCDTLEMKSDLVRSDRALGYSWKEVYRMNHGSQGTKRLWLRGCHSNFSSYQQLPKKIMCTMDAEGWGQIFEMELER